MFLETICMLNGKVQNLDVHIRRMQRTAEYFRFDPPELPDLEELLTPGMDNIKVKCSIQYHNEINSISFERYFPKVINSLKLVNASPDYAFKFSDRRELNDLLNLREECEEVLIVRNGYITDTTFSNVVLQKGEEFHTPHNPILNGTKRQKLLQEGKISEKIIKKESLKEYSRIYLINAMLDIEDNISVKVDMIKE
ncbi:MAG: aminotransferase class IV [Fermentimonas sp.]|nr:aminotransferase class IV [Fermentimonas sp.]